MITMSYRREPKVYRLQFADEEYSGLEVMVRSIPVGDFLGLARMHAALDEQNPDLDAIDKLFATFADKLIGWNLEDAAGDKVPANLRGVKAQDLDFVLAIIGAWIDAMSGVPKELGKGSTPGETFPEVDVPTEALSPSLQS